MYKAREIKNKGNGNKWVTSEDSGRPGTIRESTNESKDGFRFCESQKHGDLKTTCYFT